MLVAPVRMMSSVLGCSGQLLGPALSGDDYSRYVLGNTQKPSVSVLAFEDAGIASCSQYLILVTLVYSIGLMIHCSHFIPDSRGRMENWQRMSFSSFGIMLIQTCSDCHFRCLDSRYYGSFHL